MSLWREHMPSDKLKVWVGSWNVGDCKPPSNLQVWIPSPRKEPYDLYAIGLQEIGASSNRDAWGLALLNHLNAGGRSRSSTVAVSRGVGTTSGNQYYQVAAQPLWEMGIWVFARAQHVVDITQVACDTEATGISLGKQVTGMQLGNKGACAIGFRWRDTTFAFINCHFAARPERVAQREADYRQITAKLRLTPDRSLDVMHNFEHLFWFGDLNYRVRISVCVRARARVCVAACGCGCVLLWLCVFVCL